MYKFSLIIALCLGLPIAHGEGYIVGGVEWDPLGKAMLEDEIILKFNTGLEGNPATISTFQNATSKKTGEKVEIKLEDKHGKECYLPQEVQVYEELQKRAENLLDKGFANLYGYGYYRNSRVLITSQLGVDLVVNTEQKGTNFYKYDELRFIATSAIDQLHFLHDTGYVHNDIKPRSFMYGLVDPKNNGRVSLKNRIYLKDFGGATRYREANGTHYKQSAAAPFAVTTHPYYSRTSLEKLMRSRRDDMEALGYTLLMCVGVEVPWNKYLQNDEKKIIEEQNRLCDKLEVVSICSQSEITDERVLAAFSTYFFLLKKLFTGEDSFCREPDYTAFKNCFGEDPNTYYFHVTGKKLDKSPVMNRIRRVAKNLSFKNKSKQRK